MKREKTDHGGDDEMNWKGVEYGKEQIIITKSKT